MCLLTGWTPRQVKHVNFPSKGLGLSFYVDLKSILHSPQPHPSHWRTKLNLVGFTISWRKTVLTEPENKYWTLPWAGPLGQIVVTTDTVIPERLFSLGLHWTPSFGMVREVATQDPSFEELLLTDDFRSRISSTEGFSGRLIREKFLSSVESHSSNFPWTHRFLGSNFKFETVS